MWQEWGRRRDMRAEFWRRDMKERDYLEHLNIDGRTILKCI